MSSYTDLDPEFAALLPLPTVDLTDVNLLHEQGKALPGIHAEFWGPRLPAESTYIVKDYKVPVESGEIQARCVVPSGATEGKTFPVLMWFHSGVWIVGDLETNNTLLRILAVEHQISVVNVDYRLLPEHPFPIPWEDCYTATKWVVENVQLLSASLRKGFLVSGSSAGGNLAASTALRARDDAFFAKMPITGQVLLVPATLHPDTPQAERWKTKLRSYELNEDAPILSGKAMRAVFNLNRMPPEDTRLSILLHPSHANLPPVYFQIAGYDPLHDEGLLYAELIAEAGVKTRVDTYLGLPHGFEFMFPHLKSSAKGYSDLDEGIKWLLSQSRS